MLYRESSTCFTGILDDSLLICDAGLAIGNVLRWKRNIFNCVRIRRIGREVILHSAAGQCYMEYAPVSQYGLEEPRVT